MMAAARFATSIKIVLGLLLALAAVLALQACSSSRDAERLAMCRAATEALLPADATPHYTAEPDRDMPPASGDSLVLSYLASPSSRHGWTVCRFERASVLAPPRLSEVTTSDGGTVPPAVMFFLRTYALGQPSGYAPTFQPLSPALLFIQRIVNGLRLGGLIALAAMGFTLVFAHVGRLHLALGDFATVAALTTLLLTAFLTGAAILPLWLTILLTVAAGTCSGALWSSLTGAGAFGRLWRTPTMAPLIASIGLSIALREGARIAQGWREPWLPDLLPPPLTSAHAGGLSVPAAALLNVGVAVGCWLLIGLIMQQSAFGRAARAIADDLAMAAFSGVRIARVRALLFGLGGACSALAGALMLLSYGTVGSEGGFILGIKAATAAILGGIGSLSGALLGGLAIGVIESLWSSYFDPAYRDAAILCILVAILVLRPKGVSSGRGR